MSHSQFHGIKLFILRHAWLNLWDKHMTTGRINQITIFITATRCAWEHAYKINLYANHTRTCAGNSVMQRGGEGERERREAWLIHNLLTNPPTQPNPPDASVIQIVDLFFLDENSKLLHRNKIMIDACWTRLPSVSFRKKRQSSFQKKDLGLEFASTFVSLMTSIQNKLRCATITLPPANQRKRRVLLLCFFCIPSLESVSRRCEMQPMTLFPTVHARG